jgi:hypothetical protein
VIIDAGSGSFINNSMESKGIATGEGGSWKVYSYSPVTDTFGAGSQWNLDSGTYALWGRGSDSYAYTAVEADDANAVGRYVFQVKPVAAFTADDKTKVYGDEVANTATWQVSADVASTDVLAYKGKAFDESAVLEAASVTGTASSAGFAADAGVGNYAINMNTAAFDQSKAVAHGYNPIAAGVPGTLTVTPRDLTVAVELSSVYGSDDYIQYILTSMLYNDDAITNVDFLLNDSYTDLIGDNAVYRTGA